MASFWWRESLLGQSGKTEALWGQLHWLFTVTAEHSTGKLCSHPFWFLLSPCLLHSPLLQLVYWSVLFLSLLPFLWCSISSISSFHSCPTFLSFILLSLISYTHTSTRNKEAPISGETLISKSIAKNNFHTDLQVKQTWFQTLWLSLHWHKWLQSVSLGWVLACRELSGCNFATSLNLQQYSSDISHHIY